MAGPSLSAHFPLNGLIYGAASVSLLLYYLEFDCLHVYCVFKQVRIAFRLSCERIPRHAIAYYGRCVSSTDKKKILQAMEILRRAPLSARQNLASFLAQAGSR